MNETPTSLPGVDQLGVYASDTIRAPQAPDGDQMNGR